MFLLHLRRWAVVLALPVFVTIFLCYTSSTRVSFKTNRNFKGSSAIVDCRSTKDPILLLLESGEGKTNSKDPQPLRYLEGCEHKCCYTYNWDEFIHTADLVGLQTYHIPQIHGGKLNESFIRQLQEINKDQIWLGATGEPPHPWTVRAGSEIDGIFHWIGNYRHDADIHFSYGHLIKLGNNSAKHSRPQGMMRAWEYQNLHPLAPRLPGRRRRKRKKFRTPPSGKRLAAWLVTHCETRGNREVLVKSLQKYFQIDVYGRCGNLRCPAHGSCLDYLAANYKFYLAFENSLCIDYVTEKMWSHLARDILPITYSWINKTDVFPPNSYISALDFASVKDLAHYVIFLNENESEYRKYFRWKDTYRVYDGGKGVCEACERLWQIRKNRGNSGGAGIKRHGSMLSWMNSLPENSKNLDGSAPVVDFKIGNHTIATHNTCIDPIEHSAFMNWLRDVK